VNARCQDRTDTKLWAILGTTWMARRGSLSANDNLRVENFMANKDAECASGFGSFAIDEDVINSTEVEERLNRHVCTCARTRMGNR